MSNPSFHLYQLQKVDLRLDQLNQRLEIISTLMLGNPQLRETERLLKSSQEAIRQKENEMKALEDVAKSKKIKIEQSEASLYKGSISNPKELKDLQAEIESLKRALSAIEEDQFAIMSVQEDLGAQLKENEAGFKAAQGEHEAENQQFLVEKNDLEKEKEKLQKEREAATGQIPANILTVYEKLRISKKHIAVTPIDDQCCATCGSEITASDIQKARLSSSLSFCPFCGRILYAG